MGKALFLLLILLLTTLTMNVDSKRHSKKQRTHYYQKLLNGTKITKPCKHTCPRGQELRRNCSKYKDTKCSKCRHGTFSSHKSKHCRPCKFCQKGFYAERPCTAVRDTKCMKIRKCGSAHLSPRNKMISNSEKNHKCFIRMRKSKRIFPEKVHNVTKFICSAGYYLRQSGGNYSCTPCTSCKTNEVTQRQCRRTQDTVCGGCKKGAPKTERRIYEWVSEAWRAYERQSVLCWLERAQVSLDEESERGYFQQNSTSNCLKCSLCYGQALGINVQEEVVQECDQQQEESSLYRCFPISFYVTSTMENILPLTNHEDTLINYENNLHSSIGNSEQSDLQWTFNIIIGILTFILVFLISMLLFCKFSLSRRKKKQKCIRLHPSTKKSKELQKEMPFILHRYIQDIDTSAQSFKNGSDPGCYSRQFTYVDNVNRPFTEGDQLSSLSKTRIEKRKEVITKSCPKYSSTLFDSKNYDELNCDRPSDPQENSVYVIKTYCNDIHEIGNY